MRYSERYDDAMTNTGSLPVNVKEAGSPYGMNRQFLKGAVPGDLARTDTSVYHR